MAFLGAVRACVQAGNLAGSLYDGQKEQRSAGYRRCDVCGHRAERSGRVSVADTERVSRVPLSAAGGAKEGDTKGRGKGPRPFDSGDSRPRGPGSVEAHTGTDLRGRLSTGVVWLPAATDGSAGGVACG